MRKSIGAGRGPTADAIDFMATYETARGRPLDDAERRLALGVAVWMRAFLARWEHSQELPGTGLRDNLATTCDELLRLAPP